MFVLFRVAGQLRTADDLAGVLSSCFWNLPALSFSTRTLVGVEAEMVLGRKKPAGRPRGGVISALAITSLLFPLSTSVLCVGPGGHVAVEDFSALCCATSVTGAHAPRLPDEGAAAPQGCQDCTDIYLTRYGRESAKRPYSGPDPNSPAASPLRNQAAAESDSSRSRSGSRASHEGAIPVASRLPLRC
jgi:hypothetical protein